MRTTPRWIRSAHTAASELAQGAPAPTCRSTTPPPRRRRACRNDIDRYLLFPRSLWPPVGVGRRTAFGDPQFALHATRKAPAERLPLLPCARRSAAIRPHRWSSSARSGGGETASCRHIARAVRSGSRGDAEPARARLRMGCARWCGWRPRAGQHSMSAEMPLKLATLQAAATSIMTCSTCPPPIGGSRPSSR